jgi:hypothetical protein
VSASHPPVTVPPVLIRYGAPNENSVLVASALYPWPWKRQSILQRCRAHRSRKCVLHAETPIASHQVCGPGVTSLIVNSKDRMAFSVRTATGADADAIIAILEGIASEQIYTAINKPWSAD